MVDSAFKKKVSLLSDDDLLSLYYSLVLESLGSELDRMYELGYSFSDIAEREIYEKMICAQSDYLEQVCHDRGLVLWS